MKLNINNLLIEVTRRCNISCSHCLRGEQENLDMNEQYIDQLLNNVSTIGSVTFSGGEPTLNVEAMEHFLKEVQKRGIDVGSFYIATNGLDVTENFVLFCLKMYNYCDDKEMCLVHVSNDEYHAAEANYDTTLLSGLGFFNRKFEKEADTYPLMNMGECNWIWFKTSYS